VHSKTEYNGWDWWRACGCVEQEVDEIIEQQLGRGVNDVREISKRSRTEWIVNQVCVSKRKSKRKSKS